MSEERFLKAQECINRINDVLEYAYKEMTVEQLRQTVLNYLTEYSADITDSMVMQCVDCDKLCTSLEAASRRFSTHRCYCGGTLTPKEGFK